MIRIPSLLMIALVGFVHSAAADSLPLQLKTSVTITQDVIKVGDLWDNAGDKAELAIAQAPQLGKRVTLDARWLSNLAARNGLDWRPANQFERSVVERAGQPIDLNLVETELREALTLEGLPKSSAFEITNRQSLSIVVPADAQPTIAIKDLIIDTRSQRFTATVEAPAGAPTAQKIKVSGRTFATTKLPVLSHAMNRGETITAQDLVWTEIRDDNLHQDLVIDPKQIVGMEPRSLVKSNAPIRMADLQRPMAISRNGLVTMTLQTPYMTLTTQGKALEDGGVGDVVRITNLQTKQVVEARVQAPGMVVVAATAAIAPTSKASPLTAAAY